MLMKNPNIKIDFNSTLKYHNIALLCFQVKKQCAKNSLSYYLYYYIQLKLLLNFLI